MATRKVQPKGTGKAKAKAKPTPRASTTTSTKVSKAHAGDRMAIDLAQLETLMEALDRHGITELEIDKGGERIVLRRGTTVVAAPHVAAAAPAAVALAQAAPTKPAEPPRDDANIVVITSPFVGTFYRSPTPTAAAFVELNVHVRAGQAICIVEAMKLMNEIECEVDGTVVEILAENGKPVEYGDKLFKIRRS